MLARLAVIGILIGASAPTSFAEVAADDAALCACDATPAACDTACACDSECEVDWKADECAQPGAGCLPGAPDPNETSLAADEAAMPEIADPIEWTYALSGSGGINRRAITTIGTSMHSTYSQYRYLDQPSHDLAAITRQVNAIRGGSGRLRSQHGLGFYFVNKSDMAPPGAYSYDGLIRRMRLQALRFK